MHAQTQLSAPPVATQATALPPLAHPRAEPASEPAPRVGDTWYRFEDVRYAASLDEYERPMGEGSVKVELRHFVVVKVTPKSVQLVPFYGHLSGGDPVAAAYRWLDTRPEFRVRDGQWVRLTARKRLAQPTQARAMQSFLARKQAQERILLAQLRAVQKAQYAACNCTDPAARVLAEQAQAARGKGQHATSDSDFN